MALDLPKLWPACPGCSQSVTSANAVSGSDRYIAHPCGCLVPQALVFKVIKASGASA